MVTTIQLEDGIKKSLERMKLFPRETYSQVITRLLQRDEEEEVLSPETIKNIEKSLEDIRAGRTYTLKEVKKKLKMK